ncbi:hypothetical protein [Flavobacterium sp.]|jgi:hypothetical protein|uniref:hypothetical protein n=1 Tax=Flavobacterium sp. TaxID=239 RepID=UPI003783EE84
MKSTITFLGLALLTVNGIKANELLFQEVMQKETATITVVTNQQSDSACDSTIALKTKEEANTGDNAFFNPESVLKVSHNKPIDQVVKEDMLVTEAQEEVYQPLCIEMSVQDKIQEDNQIIESNISEEVFPLDFEKINRTAACIKVNLNNTAIPLDIKL